MSDYKRVCVITAVHATTLRASSAVIEPSSTTDSYFDEQQVAAVTKELLGDHLGNSDIEAFCKEHFYYLQDFTNDDGVPSLTMLWRSQTQDTQANYEDSDNVILQLHFARVAVIPPAK